MNIRINGTFTKDSNGDAFPASIEVSFGDGVVMYHASKIAALNKNENGALQTAYNFVVVLNMKPSAICPVVLSARARRNLPVTACIAQTLVEIIFWWRRGKNELHIQVYI